MLFGTLLFGALAVVSAAKLRQGDQSQVLASAPAGKFLGLTQTTRGGQQYYTFKGIPYAEAPERFQATVLKRPIEGVYNATHDRSICSQMDSDKVVQGSEDCLFLTVSYPHPDRCKLGLFDRLLPVMFWIHPGAYIGGSGSGYEYNGTYLLDRCVVLVTINYRLGALGFLTTGDDVIPGNLGLKDQNLALKWTKGNIASFRGDPNRVTIFGASAGASSVSHHICSPASKGLFQQAISMSGAVLEPWGITENPKNYAERLASRINCTTSDSAALRTCLLEKRYDEIVNVQSGFDPPVSYIVFSPTIEPSNAKSPFQTENPYQLLKRGQINNVPYIAGFVEEEGIYFAESEIKKPGLLGALNDYWTAVAPVQLFYDQLEIPAKERDEISNKIRKRYFETAAINESRRKELTNLVADRTIVQGIYETVQLMAQNARTYLYVNTYKGGISYAKQFDYYKEKGPVITHVDDEQYIFPKFKEWTSGPNYQFSLDMVELWTNFARFGIPFGRATLSAQWMAVLLGSPVYRRVYNLDAQNRYLTDYLKDTTEFWRGLGLYKYEWAYKNSKAL